MELEKRAESIAASMLKTNKLIQLDRSEFDEHLLDFAKEMGHEYIHTIDKNYWLIRHYNAKGIEFVQAQSPNKKIKYYTPKIEEALSFKGFLLAEKQGLGWWVRAQLKG